MTKAPKIAKAQGRRSTAKLGGEIVDVGTTKRQKLTPTERLKMFEEHGGICKICTRKITPGEKWIDEHGRALGLGGSNSKKNRYPVHVACAAVKTHDEDMPRIVKAKAQKKAALGIKDEAARPLQSRNDLAGRPKPDKPKKERKPYVSPFEGLGGSAISRRFVSK